MENWLKQTDQPLFPDVQWARPERKSQAGKLLIIGGHLHGFDRIAAFYQAAAETGVGEIKVVLPHKLRALLGGRLDNAVFAASTLSGTLSQDSAEELESYAEWADATVLLQPGENSETALLMTRLLGELTGPLIVGDDIVNLAKHDLATRLKPGNTLAVLSLAGLQSLLRQLGAERNIRSDMGLRPLVLALTEEERLRGVHLVTVYEDNLISCSGGRAVATAKAKHPDITALMAFSAAWWIWHPSKPLAALATAAFEF